MKDLGWRECLTLMMDSIEYRESGAIGQLSADVIIYAATRFNFLMPIWLKEPLTFHSYVLSRYEEMESDLVHVALSKGDIAVDLGARHGWFTGIMAKAVGTEGVVYSFEPMPPVAGVRQVVEIKGFSNVVTIDAGASDKPGTLAFDSGSLSMMESGKQSIRITTLDEALAGVAGRVKLIKADIEGAELLAFKGGYGVIKQHHPIIVFEIFNQQLKAISHCSVKDAINWLQNLGYTQFNLLDGRSVQESDLEGDRIINVVARTSDHPALPT